MTNLKSSPRMQRKRQGRYNKVLYVLLKNSMYFWRRAIILGIETILKNIIEDNLSEMTKDSSIYVVRYYLIPHKINERKVSFRFLPGNECSMEWLQPSLGIGIQLGYLEYCRGKEGLNLCWSAFILRALDTVLLQHPSPERRKGIESRAHNPHAAYSLAIGCW